MVSLKCTVFSIDSFLFLQSALKHRILQEPEEKTESSIAHLNPVEEAQIAHKKEMEEKLKRRLSTLKSKK